MVNQITNQFRSIYLDEFKMDYDRDVAKMKIATSPNGAISGGTAYFDVVDPADEAIEKTRDGRVPKSDLGLSQVAATVKKIHKKYQIDNFDLFRANKNTRMAMSKRGRGAINKGIDKLVLTTLDATSVVHPDGTVVASTLSVVQRALLVLLNKDIPDDGNVFGVITPAFAQQLLRIPEFKSKDYTSVAAVDNNAWTMNVREWMGVKWFTHTGLTGNGTATSNNFIFHRDAVGHLLDGEPKPHMFESEEDDYEGIRFDVTHAACVPLPRGVIKIVHNDTAALA